jgi:hypothetical protein
MRYYRTITTICLCACVAACAATPQQTKSDLNLAFNVAAAAEAAYAARPEADPAKTAQARALLSAAQAAVLTWTNSGDPADENVANAAVAALVAYEASLVSVVPTGH